VCFFLFISFIIPLYLFNIICRVALLEFCFSGKITRFSQQLHVVAVKKRTTYLLGKRFIIHTNLLTLWELMTHVVQTPKKSIICSNCLGALMRLFVN